MIKIINLIMMMMVRMTKKILREVMMKMKKMKMKTKRMRMRMG